MNVIRRLPLKIIRGRHESTQSSTPTNPTSPPNDENSNRNDGGINTNVPGLSSKVYKMPEGTVGPSVATDKSGAFKVPEYFCFHEDSFAQSELELAKYRLPQPSVHKASN